MLFLGLLIYLLLVFVRPQEFIASIRGWRLEQAVMGVVVIGLSFRLLSAKKYKLFNSHQNILMILFWIAVVLSTFKILWISYTFNTFIEWGKFILIYFAIINIIDSQRKLEITIWTIVLGMLITAGMGILQHYGIDVTGVGSKLYRDSNTIITRIRGIGIFDMNQLAHACAFVNPLVFGLFLKTKNILLKLILVTIFAVFYYAIYLTVSRGGIIAGIAVIALIFIFFTRNKLAKVFGIGVTSAVFVFLLKVLPRLQTITAYQTEVSAKSRLDVWGEALMVLKTSPILGVGKNQFGEYCSISPHNSYIQTVTELGLIGLFLWLALFYYSIKNLRFIEQANTKSLTKFQIIFSKCIQISLITYLISSLFSGSAYYITLYIMFALVVVLQYTSGLEFFQKKPYFYFRNLISILIAESCVILIIHFFVS